MTKHFFAAAVVALVAVGCESRSNETSYVAPAPAPVAPKSELPPSAAPIGGGPVAEEPSNAPADEATPAASTPAVVPVEGAVLRMAEARCMNAQRCDHVGLQVGKGKKEGDWAKCIDTMQKTSAKGVTNKTCTKGIDGAKLESCLDTIRNGSCADIKASIETLKSCATASLCAK